MNGISEEVIHRLGHWCPKAYHRYICPDISYQPEFSIPSCPSCVNLVLSLFLWYLKPLPLNTFPQMFNIFVSIVLASSLVLQGGFLKCSIFVSVLLASSLVLLGGFLKCSTFFSVMLASSLVLHVVYVWLHSVSFTCGGGISPPQN